LWVIGFYMTSCYEISVLGKEKTMTDETKEKETTEKKRTDENVIYVGHKPPMSYVLAVVTQFQGSGSDEVIIKARGRAISTAVDTAEIVRNRFVKDAKIKDIQISTESVTNEEGRTSNVSSMEIILTTKKKKKEE
jgi:DNA-binding protein